MIHYIGHCDSCGYAYHTVECVLCGDGFEVCGCDFGRVVCDECEKFDDDKLWAPLLGGQDTTREGESS